MAKRSLTVSGVLLDDGTLRLDPGFVVEAAPTPTPDGGPDSPDVMLVESFGQKGELLDVTLVATTPLCMVGSGQAAPRLAAGVIEIEERARLLRFRFHGQVVREVSLPAEGPSVELAGRPDGAGIQMIEWSVAHPLGAEVTCVALYFSEGRGWQPLSLPQQQTSVPVNFDDLPGGDACRIKVMATDGAHTAVAESTPFPVQPKGWQIAILSPDDGAVLTSGGSTCLTGQAVHWEQPDDRTDEMQWTSSVDGELGGGTLVDVILSPGDHLITARIPGERAQPASVIVSVRPDPCAQRPD